MHVEWEECGTESLNVKHNNSLASWFVKRGNDNGNVHVALGVTFLKAGNADSVASHRLESYGMIAGG